jgi:hypothetical protein
MAGVLASYKQAYGGQWAAALQRLDPPVAGKLRELFGAV